MPSPTLPPAPCPAPPFPTLRAAGILGGLTVMVVGFTAAVLLVLGSRQQLAAAVALAGGCLLAAVASLLPVHFASRGGDIGRVAMAALGGTVIRLGGSLGLAAGIGWLLALSSRTTAAWTLAWYLLLMAAEAAVLIRYFKTLPTTTATQSGDHAQPVPTAAHSL